MDLTFYSPLGSCVGLLGPLLFCFSTSMLTVAGASISCSCRDVEELSISDPDIWPELQPVDVDIYKTKLTSQLDN